MNQEKKEGVEGAKNPKVVDLTGLTGGKAECSNSVYGLGMGKRFSGRSWKDIIEWS